MLEPQDLFLEQLDTIETVVRLIARRAGLQETDADDFSSNVKLRLIERNYARLREFEGRCSFRMFITIVAQRMLIDDQRTERGRWRPSKGTQQLGAAAMKLEQLIRRDHLSVNEAVEIVATAHPAWNRDDLRRIAERLPNRTPRTREIHAEVELDEIGQVSSFDDSIDIREQQAVGNIISRIVRKAIDGLPKEDRLIFRLRYEAGFTIPQIARSLATEQKPIYARLERYLRKFRKLLESAGVRPEVAVHLASNSAVDFDFGFSPANEPEHRSPEGETSTTSEPEG